MHFVVCCLDLYSKCGRTTQTLTLSLTVQVPPSSVGEGAPPPASNGTNGTVEQMSTEGVSCRKALVFLLLVGNAPSKRVYSRHFQTVALIPATYRSSHVVTTVAVAGGGGCCCK